MCLSIDRLDELGNTIRNIVDEMKLLKKQEALDSRELQARAVRYTIQLYDAVKEIEEQLEGVREWDLNGIIHSYL